MSQRIYKVLIKKHALKQLQSIPKKFALKIDELILELSNNPYPKGIKKLQGYQDIYRLRYADYRIIYHVKDDFLEIEIIQIGDRKDIYNKL